MRPVSSRNEFVESGRVHLNVHKIEDFSCTTPVKYTACVNKSASLKEHFFLGKMCVSFEKVYNNMIGNIIIVM